jgi:modulator of FtsH protease
MARRYGVTVRALNVSGEQIAYARDRARAEGLADRVEFIEDDYRNVRGQYDAFVSIGMLFAQSFVAPLRRGAVGMTWLFALSVILGLSLGPIIAYYSTADPTAVTQAAGGTALITLSMGAWGLATSKDLARWIRPLSIAMLVLFGISLLLLLFGGAGSPLFSLVVLGVSAALLVVDFNYVRRHADEDDVIWLATGIYVSVVNIFLSLLNLFSR